MEVESFSSLKNYLADFISEVVKYDEINGYNAYKYGVIRKHNIELIFNDIDAMIELDEETSLLLSTGRIFIDIDKPIRPQDFDPVMFVRGDGVLSSFLWNIPREIEENYRKENFPDISLVERLCYVELVRLKYVINRYSNFNDALINKSLRFFYNQLEIKISRVLNQYKPVKENFGNNKSIKSKSKIQELEDICKPNAAEDVYKILKNSNYIDDKNYLIRPNAKAKLIRFLKALQKEGYYKAGVITNEDYLKIAKNTFREEMNFNTANRALANDNKIPIPTRKEIN